MVFECMMIMMDIEEMAGWSAWTPCSAMDIRRVQRPTSYLREQLAYSDLVPFCGRFIEVPMSALCLLLAVFMCCVSVHSSALLSSLLLILWISWMCSVAVLHALSVPCTLCIHWLALTMKQSVYLLRAWFDNIRL